ncbi:TAM domain methyltransferase [Trichophyton interdigitale]|uniref:TAM domain methyltransferase n=1 Tax=Trichophyton interdigitale TaxID=101480 RepID=A0A9P4YJ89_9EURO|nr:TAM domain methyltransferase [Trichophyton interdigitale]KAG8209228.1 TAM domain methyltransferase [Trichophyton interdigitale]
MVAVADRSLEIDAWKQAENDDESTHGEFQEEQSYLSSLTSSVVNYKYENGRRYHAFREGIYTLPNDKEEQDRMDFVHHIYLLLLGGALYVAPISDPRRVLDLGTGTGLWVNDFADEHPNAEVFGTDLSAIQSPWVPPNVIFEIDDYETEWSYSSGFDFIHSRELMGFIGDHDRFMSQAYENLNPGGWLEMQTTDPTLFSVDGGMERAKILPSYIANLHRASAMFGKSMTEVNTWPSRMVRAGFKDVQVQILTLPTGTWPKDAKLKEIGKFQQVQIAQAVGAYTPALYTRVLKWTREEVNDLCAKVRAELQDRSLHLYLKVHIVIGRKP